ncbi:hypothetical protein OR1_02053 [Geobacter sp. OR-1]|uniref:hypothetical protein n=1 Tax=Geobacter sp. OR-1 TaxID=1266765 RepID=UPI0005430BA1|nr:hypothetical protein [Geobacter sp. OR-1]GAM09772.1 hypothetical protein OR1_02053 [Geobacter sp. OR-1]
MKEKETQEASLIGRIFCMEALILLMGLISLGSGFYTGESIQLFWGGMIITGAIILHFVRKKDWKSHWEEQEKMKQVYEEMRKREKGDRDAGK